MRNGEAWDRHMPRDSRGDPAPEEWLACGKPVHSSTLSVQVVGLQLGQTMGRKQGCPGLIPKTGPRQKAELALKIWLLRHRDRRLHLCHPIPG